MENPDYGFSKTEIDALEASMNVIDKSVNSLESSLNYQKVVIDAYLR